MEQSENQLIGLKKQKLKNLLKLEVNPYPAKSFFSHKIDRLIEEKETIGEEKITLVGRIFSLRRQGKVGFSNIGDDSGKIQLYIKKDNVGEQNYEVFKLCDIGDFVQVEGRAFTTNSGEFSLKVENLTILCKTIRPLPIVKEKNVDGKLERFDVFADTELRYRKRYLDLLLNPSVREDFKKRSLIISSIRKLLDEKGFLEVDTPILQPLYGGANAKPFFTRYNSLDRNFFLRIATELYLKRLIVGGFDKVYEIGKNFRNEGMDRTHNPEFTLIELYQAFGDINSMMEICQYLIQGVAKTLNAFKVVFNHHEINLENPFKKASMLSLINEYTKEDFSDFNLSKLKDFCSKNEIEFNESMGAGALIAEIFDKFVEAKLVQPTFVLDYPKEISPLAKANPDNANLTERFELFIGGKEIANAFSELNDPLEQRKRLEEQAKKREMGDLEANQVDEDFLEALEYGMPPTGGLGIGIDRMVMLLLSKDSIKDVILFPQMRM